MLGNLTSDVFWKQKTLVFSSNLGVIWAQPRRIYQHKRWHHYTQPHTEAHLNGKLDEKWRWDEHMGNLVCVFSVFFWCFVGCFLGGCCRGAVFQLSWSWLVLFWVDKRRPWIGWIMVESTLVMNHPNWQLDRDLQAKIIHQLFEKTQDKKTHQQMQWQKNPTKKRIFYVFILWLCRENVEKEGKSIEFLKN